MIDTKDFQDFEEIHDNEIKKIQDDMLQASNKFNIAMGEFLAAKFFMSSENGKISFSIESDLPQLEMECSKSQAVFFVYEILKVVYNGDFKRAFSDVAAFEVFTKTNEQRGTGYIKHATFDKTGKSKEEINLFDTLMKMSPEELAKLKEQMNE
jgi:hypothetical protein